MNTCACGCGQVTSVWTRNQASLGRVKGEHCTWVSGHHRRIRRVVDGRLLCRDCGEWKPLEEFHNNAKAGSLGKASYCRACNNIRARWSHAAIKYGMTRTQYEALVEAQGGVCAICGFDPGRSVLHIDHCHVTGAVRGLLCSPCNQGLGHLRDDVKLLQRAIDYLT